MYIVSRKTKTRSQVITLVSLILIGKTTMHKKSTSDHCLEENKKMTIQPKQYNSDNVLLILMKITWFCLHVGKIIPNYHPLNPQLVYTDGKHESFHSEITRDQLGKRRDMTRVAS